MPTVPPPPAAGAPAPPARPKTAPEPADPAWSQEPSWPLWSAVAGIALGFGLGLVFSLALDVVAQATGSSLTHPPPAITLSSDVLFDVAFVLAAVYVVHLTGAIRPSDFGFRRLRLRRAVAAVLAAGVAYYVLTAIYAAALNLHGNEKLPSELGVNRSSAALAGAAVFVCVIAPVAEELFFRGFLFGVLRRWRILIGGRDIGTWVAAAITGILFGLAHTGSASPRYLIPLGFLGFVLCLIRWRTASLYPCMALHSLNNALALGVGQLNWGAAPVVALIVGSVAVVTLLTWPLSRGRMVVV